MAGTLTQIYIHAVFPVQVEKYHRKNTFRKEYLEFLEKFEVPYEERFLFDGWKNNISPLRGCDGFVRIIL